MTLATLGYVGYSWESTEGTFVPPQVYLPVTSFSFDDSNDYMVPDQIRGSRDRSVALPGPYSTSGSIDMELVPNGIGALLKSAFASQGSTSYTSTYHSGSGSYYYTYTFLPGSISPYFTFEADAGHILTRRYGGTRVNTLEIQSSFGEIVTASFGLEGTTRTKITSNTGAGVNFDNVVPFHFTGAKVTMAGSPKLNVKSFTFGTNNNIDRIGTLRQSRAYRRTVLGMRDVSLSMTLDFDGPSDYQAFLDEDEFEIILTFEGQQIGSTGVKNSLEITIPRVRYNNTSVPISGGDYIEQSVDCQILRKVDNTPIFTAVLVNGEKYDVWHTPTI